MSINNAAILTELNISCWTATKLDRGQTDKVNTDNQATRNAARVQKDLMAGTKMLDDIRKFSASLRQFHLWRTLPWLDRGPRLLPVSAVFDYKAAMNDRIDGFNALVDKFVNRYPDLVQQVQAKSTGLGYMFNPSDYPDASEIRGRFGVRLVFSPLPDSGDFRLDIPQEDLDDMRRGYEDNFNERLKEATQDAWDRLHKMLTTMSDKLTDVEGQEKRYYDTFLENPRELCDLLGHLNITKDPQLERARADLEAALSGLDIDDIKDSATQRADVKVRVDDILKGYW